MTKLRTIATARWLMLSACFVSGPAFAQEKTYYRGTSWTIQMVHRGTGSEFGDGPYCEVKTTSFEPMSVALQFYPSREAGSYRTIIKLRKSGWQLPVGATVNVKVGNLIKIVSGNQVIEGPPMVFKVETKDTMATLVADYDPNWLAEMGNGLLNGVFLRTRYGSTLWFKFVDGDEPQWNPASFERFEQKQAFNEYQQCLSDLSQMAADPAQGSTAPSSSTSPLKSQVQPDADTPSGSPVANSRPASPAEPIASSGAWQLDVQEEEWGETCFVETQNGNVKVGFMGSPGQGLVGYVEGLFKDEKRATWHVDDKPAYVSDGGQRDSSGLHEFRHLPAELLVQMSHGKELAVTGAKGERVVVGLNGANEAIPKFKACFAKH
ncbi:hypothetical protein EHI42_25815 [Rhizobium hidalgonense]|uniref:hypothetical protein n=1 Tax=Rhizobium hidalgonense TaxID=1538159 RepID=UPI000FEC56B3|nr:hypothetical protein [Rhizobium hidalgonense]RWX10376.1 hypothetical protein EHI42_25815 [Rhizobium hidalgonense]